MKRLLFSLLALVFTVAAQAQGQFLFNTRDVAAGIDLRFLSSPDCVPIGAEHGAWHVEVLAGPNLQPLTPLLPLNRTGAEAGYPDPFGQIYTVPGMVQGQQAGIAFRFFEGTSYEAATIIGGVWGPFTHVLSEPPTPPSPVQFGHIDTCIPEPTTWASGLLGLVALLLNSRTKCAGGV
jgi:hypothetical protein